jgi:anaerobic magnesium-protoporphyrin IX monomethyl ester cyclase
VDGDDPKGGMFLTNQSYDATPLPARHLVQLSSYKYEIEGKPSTSLIAQLGCPFACGFCGGRNSKSLRLIRTRTTESIIAEVKMLYETYGYTGFMFYDDELNVNKNMIELMNELTRLQDRLGVEFRLRGFVKSQLFNEEQAQAMYTAGFRWLLSGFESGSERILENINKKATRDENTRAVEIAKNAGLKVKALMSVGHPGESPETVAATQQWLMEVEPEDFDCTVITTYPGTPYYDEAVPHESLPGVWTYTYARNGDRLHAYEIDFLTVADYYKGDPKGGYKAFVFTDFLTSEQLVEQRNWVESSVREKLDIPFPQARAALQYEHSTGQGANAVLPDFILGTSEAAGKP